VVVPRSIALPAPVISAGGGDTTTREQHKIDVRARVVRIGDPDRPWRTIRLRAADCNVASGVYECRSVDGKTSNRLIRRPSFRNSSEIEANIFRELNAPG
jgi:hypothetical protein